MRTGFVSLAIASLLFGAQPTQAAILSQAGDIADGKPYALTANSGIASYYKTGISGNVVFTCQLAGDKAKAMLYRGKNFGGHPIAILEEGDNGPYQWKLSNKGEDVGNIKIQLLRGTTATVQCKEIVPITQA